MSRDGALTSSAPCDVTPIIGECCFEASITCKNGPFGKDHLYAFSTTLGEALGTSSAVPDARNSEARCRAPRPSCPSRRRREFPSRGVPARPGAPNPSLGPGRPTPGPAASPPAPTDARGRELHDGTSFSAIGAQGAEQSRLEAPPKPLPPKGIETFKKHAARCLLFRLIDGCEPHQIFRSPLGSAHLYTFSCRFSRRVSPSGARPAAST
jgi:hypothetical protein